MVQAPWFKFYAADYMSSPFVQGLEPEQELWYLRLIIASAINLPRGCLPLANGKLWRLAKASSQEYFEQHAGAILAKFERDDASAVYRVPKVASQQLLTSVDLSAKRAQAGKRGAEKRWQSAICDDGKLPSETMANSWQKIADSDSDSDIKNSLSEPKSSSDVEVPPRKKKRAQESDPSDPAVIRIYSVYPRKVGRADALKAIAKAIARLQQQKKCSRQDAADFIYGSVAKFSESPAGQQGQYTPHCATWMNADRFLDDPTEWWPANASSDKPNGKLQPLSPSEISRRQQAGEEWRQ